MAARMGMVKPPRKRKAAMLSIGAVGLAGLIGTALLAAPNQIADAEPVTCVSRYLVDKYLILDSCDSMFADYAVIASVPVRDSMKDSSGWEQRYCDQRVDGWSTYTVFEAEDTDHIACLGRANHLAERYRR